MSHPSSDPFDPSASLPKSARERPATEWHSIENDGEGHLRYWLKRAREGAQLHGVKGAACLAVNFQEVVHSVLTGNADVA
jgi:hypothetical protein